MIGIIACAGKSTRLMPCTNFLSKQLLPLYDKPLIYYPISMLMKVGIKDIYIVVNSENFDLYQKQLGDGKYWGININIVLDKDYTEAGLQILRRMRKNISVHKMNLWNDSFISIKNKTKTIEMRLNDEKRSKIKIGDIIEFTNTTTLETLNVKVDNIFKYDDFEQLYSHHDKISIGYTEDEVADPKDMLMYYKNEEIKKYGVLGISVRVI